MLGMSLNQSEERREHDQLILNILAHLGFIITGCHYYLFFVNSTEGSDSIFWDQNE